MVKLLSHPRVQTAIGHQCMYGLTSKSGPDTYLPAKKPTMFASSSPHMLKRLSVKCDGTHRHQHLIDGRAAKAAFYPVQLIEQILRGIRDTSDAEQREAEDIEGAQLVQALSRAGTLQDTPADLQARLHEQSLGDKLDHAKVKFKYLDGRSTHLSMKWKDAYKDEYTGDVLPHNNIREAMFDDIAYLCDEVLEGIEYDDMMKDPERVVVGR